MSQLPNQNDNEEQDDNRPLTLEEQRARLRQLIIMGKERGYITYAEINDALPDDMSDADQIDNIVTMISGLGIQVTEHTPDAEDILMGDNTANMTDDDAVAEAEAVIASLEVRKEGVKYPAELIPVRLSEIYQINEAFEWVTTTVKEQLKKDFQGMEEDLDSMQQVIDSGTIGPKKKEAWLSFGIAICVILANEVDGLEWMTLIDGNREAPVLQNLTTGEWIDPMKLVWSKVKAGESCNLAETYKSLL